jgi:hypothetical protein
MNKLQLFTRYYITKLEKGVVTDQRQSRRGGTELLCKLGEGLSFLMRRLKGSKGLINILRRAKCEKFRAKRLNACAT